MNPSASPGRRASRLFISVLFLTGGAAACEGDEVPAGAGGAGSGGNVASSSSGSSGTPASSGSSASSASSGSSGEGGAGGLPDLTTAVGVGGGKAEGGCDPGLPLPESLPCVSYAPLPCEEELDAGDVLSFVQCELYCLEQAALYGCSVQEIGDGTFVACDTCPLVEGTGGGSALAPREAP